MAARKNIPKRTPRAKSDTRPIHRPPKGDELLEDLSKRLALVETCAIAL